MANRKIRKGFALMAKEAAHIPLNTKTQYPLYLEARALFLLREIAKIHEVSVQQLLRTHIEKIIDDQVYLPATKVEDMP